MVDMVEGMVFVCIEEGLIDVFIIDVGGRMYVKVFEIYDFSMKIDKMGLFGIYILDGKFIYFMWQGFYQNFRKMRYVFCDVVMVCVLMFLVDFLQIGVEVGDIVFQDMFNFILYKVVSNDSMSNLLNKIYAGGGYFDVGIWFNKNFVFLENIFVFNFNFIQDIDQFVMYYGLFFDIFGWKKVMFQVGFGMKGFVFLIFFFVVIQGQFSIFGSLSNSIFYYFCDGDNINNIKIIIGFIMMG